MEKEKAIKKKLKSLALFLKRTNSLIAMMMDVLIDEQQELPEPVRL